MFADTCGSCFLTRWPGSQEDVFSKWRVLGRYILVTIFKSCSHHQERKKVTYLLLIWMVLEFCFCRIKAWCRGQAACEELRCWWLWCRGQKWFGWKVVSFAQDYHYACTRMLVFSCPCLGISLGILQALVTYLVPHFPVAWTQQSVMMAVSTWGPFLATQF